MKLAAKWEGTPDDKIGPYCCWDTLATVRLAKRLPELLSSHGQLEFHRREIEPCYAAVIAMQLRGIPIDTTVRSRLRREFRAEVREADRYLCEAKGAPYIDFWDEGYKKYKGFKPNSDAQVRKWLFEDLHLRPAGRTETGLPSVDQENLSKIIRDARAMDRPHLPVLYALAHRSRYLKLDEYLTFDIASDGRAYPTVKMHGTESLRFAYANPPLHSWAEEIRSMVVAPPGRMLVKADFSQIEARLAAYLSSDPLDIAVYEREGKPPYKHHPDWDIHSSMAIECFRLVEDDWSKMESAQRELYRGVAKVLRYRRSYGGAPETAKAKTHCPCPKCAGKKPPTMELTAVRLRQLDDSWLSRHTAFVRWRRTLLQPFSGPHATHCLTNALGWKRWFCTPYGGELQREVYAWAISSVASIIKLRALRRMHARGVEVLLDHHDALLAECAENSVDKVKRTMIECMSEPVPELSGISFPVEVGVGGSWGELH